MSLILLPRIDRVAEIDDIRIARIRSEKRNQPGNIRLAVISHADDSEPVRSCLNAALTVELVLLPMLQTTEKTIPARSLQCDPRVWSRAESGYHVDVSVVSGEHEERIEMGAQAVGRCEVHRVISLSDVERTAVHLHALEYLRDEYVRVSVSIAVSVRG